MATTRRDIELLISARETTGRSFSQVTKNIDALNSKIAEQVAAAERGEVSLQELRKTQESLAQAGRDLSAIQNQIDAYNRLVASSDKVGAAAEKAQADLAKLKAEIEAAGTATAAQERRMQRLENAVVRTSAAVEKNNTDIAAQVAILDRAGIATADLDRAQAGIVNTARQIGAGLVQVNSAIDGYATNVQRARQAEADLNAQQGFERKIAEAQRLGQASRFVQLFGDAINTVKTADNQMAALTGFRAVGQQAAEASRDISRFVDAGQSMAVSSQQVAAGLRAIIDPGGAALQTLSGVEKAIENADQKATDSVKNVGALNDAYNDLAQASAALLRQGGLVDTFQQQAAATDAARQKFAEAQGEVQKFARAMAAADEPTEQLANALAKAEANLEKTGRALAQEETRLGQLSRELRNAGINTADLAGEQARLEASAERVAGAMERINTTLGRGGRATNGLFGLKPHDLANLSYQINDIVVSLASGQNPMMVLVQQGSQIGQLFPGLISTVARFALAWSPVIIAVAGVGLALRELYTDSVRLQQAMNDLATIPTGEGLDPQRFANVQENLENMGHSAEDARKAMLALAEEGFDNAQLEAYAETAADLADRLGIDLTEATQMLVDVQRGGIDTVYELAQETNSLTEADLDHIEALFEAGRAAEAREYALRKVQEREEEIAKLTQSQWTPAINNLKSAWQSFTGWLQSVFQPVLDGINRYIQDAIVGFTFLTGLLSGKGVKGATEDAFTVIRTQRGLNKPPARGASDQNIRDRQFRQELDAEIDSTRELTNQERLRRAETEARARAQKAGVSAALEERAVQQAVAAEQRKINKEAEKAAKRGDAAAKRAQRQAEAEQRKREQALRQLEGRLRQLNREAFTGASASLEQRLDAINEKYETIADSIAKVRGLGMTTDADGTDLRVIERQVEATKQRLKDEETIKFYQEQAALLDQQRADEIERITDAQERGALTTEEAVARAAEISGRLSPQIVAAAQKALEIARALAGTHPSPEMVSWIASLEKIISGEATTTTVADVALQGLEKASSELDDLISQRNELVAAYQTLGDMGLRTSGEMREALSQAFATSAQDIQPVLDRLRQTVETLRNTKDTLTGLPLLTDTAYNAWLAKIEAVEAGLQRAESYLNPLESQVFQGIANAGTQAFGVLAEGFVGLISGAKSFGSAFQAIGESILTSLANIAAAIANAIVQFLILRALESAAGLPPGTLSGGGGRGPSLFGLFHSGGVVGEKGGTVRRDHPAHWIGAPKFHNGGGLGLKKDEYRAVLKRGEEVLTEDNPRHVNNAGQGSESGGAAPPPLKQVLYLDPDQVVGAMQGRSGQKTFLTFIRTNKETIKQVLK